MISTRLQQLAHKVRMTVDLASNRIELEPTSYTNHQYHPDGFLVFALDTLDIWSFATVGDVVAFLRMRLYGMSCYPSIKTLNFYTENSSALHCYHHIRKIEHGYKYVGKVYSSHFDACYVNRLNDGNLYCKETHRKQCSK